MSIVKINIGDFNIDVLNNDWVGGSLINGTRWEPHITFFLERNLKKDSIFVDVGSNYGWHSIMSSNLCESIYSFEPQKYVYNIQKENIKQNNITNINLFNYGIGNVNDTLNMVPINYNQSVNVGDLSIGFGGEIVEVKTLDSLNLSKVDVIKIDVQGFEKFVIEGGVNLINKNKPLLIVEFEEHQLRKFGYGCTELFNLIRDFGYVIYFLEYHYPSDHVCVHKDMLNDFIIKNNEWIKPLTESNDLNRNVGNGVTKKITYNR